MTPQRLAGAILKAFLAVAALLVAAVISLIAFLWFEHRTAVELPAPTGPYAVGRTIEVWHNGPASRDFRAWIWYPADAHRSATPDVYLPDAVRREVERTRGPLISNYLTRDLSKVRTHSFRDADVSPRERSYPVVIIRGGAAAAPWNYSTLAEDLASHGYVVLGLDAVERRAEDNPELCLTRAGQERETCVNRALARGIAEIAFALDQLDHANATRFAGRLDTARLGVFGHSFGGATALQFCREDPRCKAGIDLDGAPQGSVVRTGLGQPFLFLLSDHSRETDPESRKIMADVHAIYDRLPPNGRSLMAVRGAHHFTFSDDGAVLKSHVLRGVLRLFGKLHIDGRRQLAVTTSCASRFFDTHLKGVPLGLPSPDYPELEDFGVRRASAAFKAALTRRTPMI